MFLRQCLLLGRLLQYFEINMRFPFVPFDKGTIDAKHDMLKCAYIHRAPIHFFLFGHKKIQHIGRSGRAFQVFPIQFPIPELQYDQDNRQKGERVVSWFLGSDQDGEPLQCSLDFPQFQAVDRSKELDCLLAIRSFVDTQIYVCRSIQLLPTGGQPVLFELLGDEGCSVGGWQNEFEIKKAVEVL